MKNRVYRLKLVGFLLVCCISVLKGHEIRPAYLEIKEIHQQVFELTWKVPVLGMRIPVIFPEFSGDVKMEETGVRNEADAQIRKYKLTSEGSLEGQQLHIAQLEKTLIDVIVRIDFLNGSSHTVILQPDHSSMQVPIIHSNWSVFTTFGILGIEHILFGWDHLLFVIGLLLLISNYRQLFWAITSFTVAHSITLGMATLGHVSLPGPPVEAIIALSVVFLAREYLEKLKGKQTLTIKFPWVVAFLFGLIHGFGFAGALEDIGLPGNALGLSLFSFNLGVEIGQLMIVGIIVALFLIAGKLVRHRPLTVRVVPGYAIGGIASFWFITRLLDIAF